MEEEVEGLHCDLLHLTPHAEELITYLNFIVLVLTLLQKFIKHFLACPLVPAKLDFVKGDPVPHNLLNILVKPLFIDYIVFILHGVYLNDISWFQGVNDVIKWLLIFSNDLGKPVLLLDIVLEYCIDLGAQTV
jgi:hypothetical protein